MFYHFTIEDILEIHRMVLEESGEEDLDDVLNWSNLRNAVDSPKRVVFGTEIYPDPISKIATLMFELATLHPFLEGNKRTALMCADSLMVLNYGVITADDDERLDVTLRLAKLEMSRDELIKWMRENSISDQRFIVRDRIQKHLRAPRFNTSK